MSENFQFRAYNIAPFGVMKYKKDDKNLSVPESFRAYILDTFHRAYILGTFHDERI